MNDKQEAQTLADGGLNVEAIAKEFGVSTATVYRWITSKETAQAAQTVCDQNLVDAYVAGELTMQDICEKYDCYSPQIYAALRRHGVTPTRVHKQRMQVEEKEQIVAMYKAGYTLKAIQHVVGRCSQSVYKALDEAKVPRRMGRIMTIPPGIDWETVIDGTLLQSVVEQPEPIASPPSLPTASTSPAPTTPTTIPAPLTPPPTIEDIIPDSDT